MFNLKKISLLLASFLIISGCSSNESNQATDKAAAEVGESQKSLFTITNIQETGIEGVSPELIQDSEGNYLLFATNMSNKRVSKSSDAITFSEQDINLPIGSDYSLIQKNDGTWLLYFTGQDMKNMPSQGQPNQPGQPVQPNQNQPGQPVQPPQPGQEPAQQMEAVVGGKKVFVSTSIDLISFSDPEETGIEQTENTMAWGVPDTYFNLNGEIEMMWVTQIPGERYEVLVTATSKDGIKFTQNEGYVIKDGYVDPYMLQVEEGNWILMLSTTPDPSRLPQKIYMAYSKDGKNWDIEKEPLMYEEGVNYLDPAAVKIGDNSWKLILTTISDADRMSNKYRYVSADLKKN